MRGKMENMKRGGGTAVSETEQVSEQSLQLRLSSFERRKLL